MSQEQRMAIDRRRFVLDMVMLAVDEVTKVPGEPIELAVDRLVSIAMQFGARSHITRNEVIDVLNGTVWDVLTKES